MITHKLEKMDFARRGPTQTVSVVQDDKYSRNLEFTLLENGEAWNRPDTLTVVVRYGKPDGTGGSYDTLPDEDETPAGAVVGNILTVALAPQVCTVPGIVRLAVALVSGSTELHTFAVNIEVQPNPGLQVTSENYFKVSGALADSGWTPNKYLATDGEGNVVAVDAPENGNNGLAGGYYVPAVTQPEAGTMLIGFQPSDADMPAVDPVTVELPAGPKGEDGAATPEAVLDAIPKAVAIDVVKSDDTVTYTTTLDDGSQSVSVVTLDSNGYPSKVVTDGVECPVSWDGFDDLALGVWEGGSY